MFRASLRLSLGGQTAFHFLWFSVVVVVMLGSRLASCVHCEEEVPWLATSSTQCTHFATRLSSIISVTTGQKTIGSVTQSDLLMMGVKTPETC